MFGLSLQGILWRIEGTEEIRIPGEYAESYRWLTGKGGSDGNALAEALATSAGRDGTVILSLARPAVPERAVELARLLARARVRLAAILCRTALAAALPDENSPTWLVDADPDGLLVAPLGGKRKGGASRTVPLDWETLLQRRRDVVIACFREELSVDIELSGEPGGEIDRWLEEMIFADALREQEVLPWRFKSGGTVRIDAKRLMKRLEAEDRTVLEALREILNRLKADEASLLLEGRLDRYFNLSDRLSTHRQVHRLTGQQQAALAGTGISGSCWGGPDNIVLADGSASAPRLISLNRPAAEQPEPSVPGGSSRQTWIRTVALGAALIGIVFVLVFPMYLREDGDPSRGDARQAEHPSAESPPDIEGLRREWNRLQEETAAARAALAIAESDREDGERQLRSMENQLAALRNEYVTTAGDLATLRTRLAEAEEALAEMERHREEAEDLRERLVALNRELVEGRREVRELADRRTALQSDRETGSGQPQRLETDPSVRERDPVAVPEDEERRLAAMRDLLREHLAPSVTTDTTPEPAEEHESASPAGTANDDTGASPSETPWITPVLGPRTFGYELRIPIRADDGSKTYAYEPLHAGEVNDVRGLGRTEDLFLSSEATLERLRTRYPEIDFTSVVE